MVKVILIVLLVAILFNPISLFYYQRIIGSLSEVDKISNPKEIEIPDLSVDAEIESVGLDDKGNMDVPKNVNNAAWYNLGYEIGEEGNAVLAGHYNDPDGNPAIFYDLKKLDVGDEIFIKGDGNEKLRFKVIQIETVKEKNFPVEEVFGSNGNSRIILISCSGQFDDIENTYTHRDVVTANLSN